MIRKCRSSSIRRKVGLILPVIVLLVWTGTGSAQIWGDDVRLTNAAGAAQVFPRSLGVSEDTLHLAFADSRDGGYKIYYKRSVDNGDTWDADLPLNDTVASDHPSIAAAGSNVHVVWSDEHHGNPELLYRLSTNNGTTWEDEARLTNDAGNSLDPVIAVDDIDVHISWSDDRDGNTEAYYKRSTNNGVNWDVDRRGSVSDSQSLYPAIAVSADNIHAVWCDDRNGNLEIYYRRSLNNGDTWGGNTRLTNADSSSLWVAIAAEGSAIHVVWEDKRDGEREVYYKRSVDNGDTWEDDTALTTDGLATPTELHPSIAVADGSVHVVWNDIVDGNQEIYSLRSTDAGITWDDIERLTEDDSASYNPAITAWDYNLHVTWVDERDGNPEVYYKRGLSGNPQPDNLIKNGFETVYIGDGIYNSDATNQVEEQAVRQGDTAAYDIRITNDGDIPDDIIVTGVAGDPGWSVAYYDSLSGGTEITDLIEFGLWSTGELLPDEYVDIRIEVIPDLSIPEDSSYEITVTSRSFYDDTIEDVVKAITTATETPGVEETSPVPEGYTLKVESSPSFPRIQFSLPETSQVEVNVSDVTGRLVKILASGTFQAGNNHIAWEGIDALGLPVPDGIYFCTLKTDDQSLSRRFILLR